MMLIADSGNTKTDWRLVTSEEKIIQYKTKGLNPYLQSQKEVADTVTEELAQQLDTVKIKEIYFYGAGCSAQKLCTLIKNALSSVFINASIQVEHDLLGAARALFNKEKGIAAISGTGSNSCVYDGTDITEHIPSTGYILGDEGCGTDLGKRLVKAFAQKQLPPEINKKFIERYNLELSDILEIVYKRPFPNRFLASFSHFLFHHLDHPFVSRLVYNSYSDYFDNYICHYSDYKKRVMRCVGSVGYYYSNILKAVAEDKGVIIDRIIESPVAGLTLYHLKK